jgi:hypothetical protein
VNAPFPFIAAVKKGKIIALAIVAVVLVLRGVGFVELTCAHLYYWVSTSKDIAQYDENPSPSLTAQDAKLTKTQREVTFGNAHVYYDETWDFPWTRWMPLIKVGESEVTRNYFAVSSGKKIFIGQYTSKTSMVVYGVLSARNYAGGGPR